MNKYIKQIRTWANIGLIGSLIVVIIAILFKYLSPMVFRQTDEVYRTLTIASSAFSILDMVVILTGIRKTKRRILATPDIEQRLKDYTSMTQTNSLYTLISTVTVSAIIILIGNYNLLMLAMMLVLILFFTYPNMYRIKVELDLDDSQMKELFGDQYVGETDEPEKETSQKEDSHE